MGRPAIKITGGGGGGGLELVCGRPTLALASALVHQTKQLRTTKTKRIKHKQEAKRAAGIEGQMASMLERLFREYHEGELNGTYRNESQDNSKQSIYKSLPQKFTTAVLENEVSENNCSMNSSSKITLFDYPVVGRGKENTSSQTPTSSHITDQRKTVSIVDMVGDTYIPDDVIMEAFNIMRQHSPHLAPYIGQLPPAMQHFLRNSNDPALLPYIPSDKISINIHHIDDHWITTVYKPQTSTVYVYDSLRSRNRISRIRNDINMLYGS